MRVRNILLTMCIAGISTAYGTPKQAQQATSSSLVFVENKGQITDQYDQPRTDIDFRIGGKGVNLFVGDAAMHYQWVQPTTGTRVVAGDTLQEFSTYRMDVQLVGANPNAQVLKEQKQDFYERYYTSSFSEEGALAHAYQKVTYKEVYPNIDWVLYVKDNTIEYDFVVRQGGKVSDIKLQYSGTSQLSINKAGGLTATTPFGTVTEAAPISFQQADGRKVTSKFILENDVLSFSVGSYKGTLVIDPTLSWATYYGGGLNDYSMCGNLTGDTMGNVYLSGYTPSTNNIATTGSHQATMLGGEEGYLAKFNSSGVRLWATYYGGASQDVIRGSTCDPSGNIFIGGYSNSASGIATTGSHQPVLAGSSDAFIAKFDNAGVRQWATYFGGSSADQGLAVTLDKTGNVYLSGYTSSTNNIATAGSHQTTRGGGQDAFLAKFSNSGSLLWSTYYGGSATDNGLALSTDSSNNIYLSGFTKSTTAIASSGAYQTDFAGMEDAFFAKFDSTGVRQWSTYFGGSAAERCQSICADANGNLYATGYTLSTNDIATAGSHQAILGGYVDAFIVKFNNSGARVWSTYYGGTEMEEGYNVKFDALGTLFVCGTASSTSAISTPGTYKDTLSGPADAYVAKFDTSGTRIWGTYYGGDVEEFAYSLYITLEAELYISGMTSSITGLSTLGSHQAIIGGGIFDAYLAKFNVCELSAPIAILGTNIVCPASIHTYSVPAVAGAISYTWMLPVGWSGSSTTNTISIQAGTITDTITVVANFLCGTSDTIEQIITVYPMPVITPSGTVSLCAGDSITLSASVGTAYQWLLGGTAIAGATNSDITISTTGSYAVVVTSANGCTDTSLITDITVNPLPVPVITANGSVWSTSLSYSSYQWNHNGSPITGATNAIYTITLNTGVYTVTVTDDKGCLGTSAPYTASTGIYNINGKEYHIKVYPNPASHTLFIDADKEVHISLRSIDGRQIADYKTAKVINISSLSEGLYFLYFTDKTGLLIGIEKFAKTP